MPDINPIKPSPVVINPFKSVNKVSDNMLEVVKEVPSVEVTLQYDYDFLISQQIAIQADLDAYTAARQAELDEIQTLLDQCNNLGIHSKNDIVNPDVEPDVEPDIYEWDDS